MPLSSVGFESFAVINEVNAQISLSERLHSLLEQIVQVRSQKVRYQFDVPFIGKI